MDLGDLIKMYLLKSESGFEYKVSMFVREKLDLLKIPYSIDRYMLYRFIPDTPLLSAHMDHVKYSRDITKVIVDGNLIKGDSGLGADDKNGVWIILNLLETFKDEVSFIFSTEEESFGKGNNVKKILREHKEDIIKLKYGLVFDRKNQGDIIGKNNNYCIDEMDSDLSEVGKQSGYKSAHGIRSDADDISDYISCVNLSVGYNNPHTEKEETNFKWLENSYQFGKAILKNVKKSYSKAYGYYEYGLENWYDDWLLDPNSNTKQDKKPLSVIDDIVEYYKHRNKGLTGLFFCEYCGRIHNIDEIAIIGCKSCQACTQIDEKDIILNTISCSKCKKWMIILPDSISKTKRAKNKNNSRMADVFCPDCYDIMITLSEAIETDSILALDVDSELEENFSWLQEKDEKDADLKKCEICNVHYITNDNICPTCKVQFGTTRWEMTRKIYEGKADLKPVERKTFFCPKCNKYMIMSAEEWKCSTCGTSMIIDNNHKF